MMLFYLRAKSGTHRISAPDIEQLRATGQLPSGSPVLSFNGRDWMTYEEFVEKTRNMTGMQGEAPKPVPVPAPQLQPVPVQPGTQAQPVPVPVPAPTPVKVNKVRRNYVAEFMKDVAHKKTFILGVVLIAMILMPFGVPGKRIENTDEDRRTRNRNVQYETDIAFPFMGVLFQQYDITGKEPSAMAKKFASGKVIPGFDPFGTLGILLFSGITLIYMGINCKKRFPIAITCLVFAGLELFNMMSEGNGILGKTSAKASFFGTSTFWLHIGLAIAFATGWTWTIPHRRSAGKLLAFFAAVALLLAIIVPIAPGVYWSSLIIQEGTGAGFTLLIVMFLILLVGTAVFQFIRALKPQSGNDWLFSTIQVVILAVIPLLLMIVLMGFSSRGFQDDIPGRTIYNTIAFFIIQVAMYAIGVFGLIHLLRGLGEQDMEQASASK